MGRSSIRAAASGSSATPTGAASAFSRRSIRCGAAHATPAQAAIAWLIAQPLITAPIASATSLKQFDEIMQAPRIKLTKDDLAALDKASA